MKHVVVFLILSCIDLLFIVNCFSKKNRYDFNDVINVKIEQNTQFGNFIIYDENNYQLILDKISNAKKVSERFCEKAVVLDGEYIIKIKTKKETFIFELQNAYWIYDVNNKTFLRCNLLEEMRIKSPIRVYYENGSLKLKEVK